MSLPINWQNLRTWNGSQHTGFEELCCQLAFYEDVPKGSRWERKGTPDGGVECLWILPGGEKRGWQSKYFLSPPDDGQWAQLDDSVRTALDKHPKLSVYAICLPCDRPDPKIKDKKSGRERKSFMDKWNERVALWKGWATSKGMDVTFEYWGESEILTRLTNDSRHAGRYKFWFEREFLSEQWFQNRLDTAVADAGPRYTAEINVELPIAKHFEGLARTSQFFLEVATCRGKLRQAWSTFDRSFQKSPHYSSFSSEFAAIQRDIERIMELLAHGGPKDDSPIQWDFVSPLADNIDDLCSDLSQKISLLRSELKSDQDEVATIRSQIRELDRASTQINQLSLTKAAKLSNEPFFLLQGNAGQGKTHLFCDVACRLLEKGHPCVVLLGEKFIAGNPWNHIIQTLGLSCTPDEFLSALEAAAQASGGRALIFIDALNEGEGKTLWNKYLAGMIQDIKRFSRVGLALSVRSTYVDLVIPPQAKPQLVEETHPGFAGHEYQATQTFFAHYKIKRPSVPLLSPEWSNPLFLKLFCQGLQNAGLSELPIGWNGITQVFGFFLKATNDKLARLLDFDESDNLVENAALAVAAEMTTRGQDWLDRKGCRDLVDGFLPGRTFQNSLFRHLLAEGVLAEERFPTWPDRIGTNYGTTVMVDGVRIGFERFGDHLRARNLLDREFDSTQPHAICEPRGAVGQLFSNRGDVYRHKGLLEALAIQIPERCGQELPYLLPSLVGEDGMQDAFMESLQWRVPEAITEETRRYINDFIIRGYHHDKLLDIFLMLAPRPDHPYNADFLHRNLWAKPMQKRDASWSIYLHESYDSQGPLDRLLDWAQSEEDKSYLDDESVRLCAVALSWCLTTSHRFVRDRATKGLVALLSSRLSVLLQLLRQFEGVNDDYVRERLLAATYGCCLRSTDAQDIAEIARYIFRQVFEIPHENGTEVWPHILGRDYARGVVEVALHRDLITGSEADHMAELARPPYNSAWPTDFPSEAEFEKLIEGNDSLYFSLSDMGDFKHYQIEDVLGDSYWSSLCLNEPLPPTLSERYDAWFEGLSSDQQQAWDAHLQRVEVFTAEYKGGLSTALIQVYGEGDENGDAEMPSDDVIANLAEKISIIYEPQSADDYAARAEREKTLREKIIQSEVEFQATLSSAERQTFGTEARPHLQYPYQTDVPFANDPLRFWIAQKVFDLGWTKGLFEDFDDRLHRHTGDRHANKSERIGKKYQWLALHEMVARVADNFHAKRRYGSHKSGERDLQSYEGPWQLSMRNIDPSFSLRQTHDDVEVPAWWAPWSYPNWHAIEDADTWVRTDSDLPSPDSLIEVVHPKDGSRWLSLGVFVRASELGPPGEDRFGRTRRFWQLLTKPFFVKSKDAEKLWTWLKKQDFSNNWTPNGYSFDEAMWGEVPWADAFRFAEPDDPKGGWTREVHGIEKIPVAILPPVDGWQHSGGEYDCSMEEAGARLSIPCRMLIEKMKLRPGREGEWIDEEGQLIAFDPSARETGPNTLLVRREIFEAFLETEQLSIMWTLQGEKQIMTGSSRFSIMLQLSGAVRFRNGKCEENRKQTIRQLRS